MIYFRCYIEDYDDATSDLSPLEDGMFFRLLRHYYRSELPLPLNGEKLARICRAITLEERDAIAAVLGRYFTRTAEGWRNERADHEIAVSKTARENGSRGGRPSAAETGTVTGSQTGSKTEQVTGEVTGSGHPSSLLTKTIPSTSQPSNQLPSDDAPRRGAGKPAVDTRTTWEAYRQAHVERYGVEPKRNARVNGQLASVVRCVGMADAPAIAAFYLRHNRAEYVKATHPTSLLARDAEGLHTQWARGQATTETEARQADRTQATGNAFEPLLEEARKREALPH